MNINLPFVKNVKNAKNKFVNRLENFVKIAIKYIVKIVIKKI